MASVTPTQRSAIDVLACNVEVGDKVYRRFFEWHELGKNEKDQWIHGKVMTSKIAYAKGPKQKQLDGQ
jgi:hypothetical protein